MTYQEACGWLFSQFPSYQQQGAVAYKPDLGNILELCRFFDLEYSRQRYIHVAGTNGKGSVCNYLAASLQTVGYKTGLFTSPHLIDFRERIRINGEVISEDAVVNFVNRIRSANCPVEPSFFEITWLMALDHFLQHDCDFCVIETGLGGRLDATNIITPLLSIITGIGFDHMDLLGNTLTAIAGEKAGIIKKGVPVVCGALVPEAEAVMQQHAENKQAELFRVTDFRADETYFPEGSYLQHNERVVRLALEVLRHEVEVTPQQITTGISRVGSLTGFRGRFELISRKPDVIADAAHNPEGIEALVKLLSSQHYRNTYVIYGASRDKAVTEILSLFDASCTILLTPFSNPRSCSEADFEKIQAEIRATTFITKDIRASWEMVQQQAEPQDLILVCGSFFLLSDFFSIFSENHLEG